VIAPNGVADVRLHDTIKSLNEKLSGIRFRSDGTGDGVIWEARVEA
jgi:hypothetical protein